MRYKHDVQVWIHPETKAISCTYVESNSPEGDGITDSSMSCILNDQKRKQGCIKIEDYLTQQNMQQATLLSTIYDVKKWAQSPTASRAEVLSRVEDVLQRYEKQHRESLLDRAREICRDIEQMHKDAAYWNENVRKPNEPELDADPDGTLAKIYEATKRMVDDA